MVRQAARSADWRRAPVPPRSADRRLHGRRHGPRRGRAAGVSEVGERRAGGRSGSRRTRAMAGGSRRGSSLHAPHAPAKPGILHGRHAVVRAGHRRERRHLHLDQRGHAADLAGAGAASARTDYASPGRAPRPGVVSAFRAVPRQRQVDLGRVRAGLGQPGRRRRRTGGVRRRGARQRRLLHRPWNRARRGPVAGQPRTCSRRPRRQPSSAPLLAAAIRRQPVSARQDRHDSRSGLHDRGGDARRRSRASGLVNRRT